MIPTHRHVPRREEGQVRTAGGVCTVIWADVLEGAILETVWPSCDESGALSQLHPLPSPLPNVRGCSRVLQCRHHGSSQRPLTVKSDARQGEQIPYLDNSPGIVPERIQLITHSCFPREHTRVPTELPLHSKIKLTSSDCVPYQPSCKHAHAESVMQIDLSTSMGNTGDNTASQYCTVTIPDRGQIRQYDIPITQRHIRFSLRETCD